MVIQLASERTMGGVLQAIGNTPMVRLSRYLDRDDIELYGKLEYLNPGGSVKDRPAAHMIGSAVRDGLIGPDTLVVESSSGNMGIGMAQACSYHGVRFRCVIDPRALPQNVKILRAYGAEIELVEEPDPETGEYLTARLRRVQEIVSDRNDVYWPNQYSNADNPRAHQLGTMSEIDDELEGRADTVFVATSSTGTAGGCADLLQERRRATKLVVVDSSGSAIFGRSPRKRTIPGLGAGVVPPLAQNREFGDIMHVEDLDCVVGCRRLARREGLLVGGSAGGVLEAIRSASPTLPPRSVVVAVLADGGTRYLDTVFDDSWVEAELGCSPHDLEAAIERDPATTHLGAA